MSDSKYLNLSGLSTLVDNLKTYANKLPERRIFKPKIKPQLFLNSIDLDKAKLWCDGFQSMGADGLIIPIHLDTPDTFEPTENMETVKSAIEYAKGLGMTVDGIKFHCTQTTLGTDTSTYAKYKEQALAVLSEIGEGIQYVTLFNEYPNSYLKSENASYVLDTINAVKAEGYKVGISFTYPGEGLRTYREQKSIVDALDIIGSNLYAKHGYKGKNTTLSDSVFAWDMRFTHFKVLKEIYPDKPVILTETGVQHFWEALAAPSLYQWASTEGVTDGGGEVAKTYFYGLFNNVDANGLFTDIWLWFPEQMLYQEFYDFIHEYTGKKVSS